MRVAVSHSRSLSLDADSMQPFNSLGHSATPGKEFIQRKSSDASDDSNDGDRPKMAIMIIGKNWSEKCHMGNVILGSYAFGNCPPSDECEANTGLVDGRHLTVVLTRNLMNNQLTQEDLQQRVKECVSLCGPSPRAYILVAQPQDFTEDDHRIVKAILTSVLDQALGSTLVVKFLPEGEDEDEIGSSVDNIVDESDALRGLIQDCGGQCYRLNRKHVEDLVQAEILQTIENMDKDETHSVYEDASDIQKQKPESDCSPNMLGSFSEQVKANNKGKTSFKSKLSKLLQPSQKAGVETPKAPSQRLNLMLFGRKGVQKTAIGNTILLQSYPKLSSKSNFMKRRAEVCGYAVTLIEAPCLARTHLSFTQVLKKCHEAISLCAPGIDAFVLAVPSVTLTDDDKEELHQIQTIFGRHVNDHIMILCTYVSAPVALDSQAFKNLEQQFRKGCFVLSQKGRKEKISELLKKIKDESDKHFTTDMYMEAQIEERVRLQEEIMDLKKLKQQHGSPDTPDSTTDCVRIVLIGKTGVGKSATGNTILGKCAFETAIWGDSVTKFCQKGTAVINDQSVAVVDTPGLFDTTVSNEEVKKEILKCFSFLAPGPHVFLLVLAIGTRMTDEERETLNLIKEAFGDNAAKFIIILFTKEDQLKGHSIETYIQKSGPEVAQLIHSCEGRFHVFNNENKNNSKQVTELMGKIDLMVKKNGGGCYTNEMFQLAESAIKEKFEKIIREREKETEREKEQLQAKFEEELRAMMEKKTEEIERERKKREMMLREKEDFINNELKKRDEKEAKERKKREEEDERRREEERTQRLAWTDTLEELKRKHQAQKEEWETEHQRRLQEEKQRAERENQEWLEREEKQKYEFDRRQEEERKRRDREEIIRWEKEEREKMRLEEKVREAEKMTAQSLAERQKELRNWEDQRTKERQREEEENKKRIQNEREEWERLKNKMKEDFEKEKEREKKDREIDEIRKREHERKERERIENEYLNTMEQNQAKQKKQEQEWEKERDELRKKREKEDNENREKFKKLKDDFEREKDDEKRKREEEDKAKEEAHKQKLEEINQQHRKRVDELNTEIEKYKDEARQAAEEHNEFVKRYDELKGDLSGDDLKKAIKEWEKKHSKTCVLL